VFNKKNQFWVVPCDSLINGSFKLDRVGIPVCSLDSVTGKFSQGCKQKVSVPCIVSLSSIISFHYRTVLSLVPADHLGSHWMNTTQRNDILQAV
jgi:hypothetical protein